MKQSSIEWIYNNLKSHFEHDGDLLEAVKMSFEQAKAMHKKEIMGAHGEEQNYLEDDGSWRMQTAEEYYNETFNTQPKMDELTQLRKLAGLLQSAWHNGNWKAETYNEREMEKIMVEQGYWPALPNPNQIGKDELLTFNTKEK
jgi:hypothetical protein